MFIISLITLVLAIMISVAVVFKRYKRFANIIFSVGLISTASVIFGDMLSIIRPESVINIKRIVFLGEFIMAIAWLTFSLTFARTDFWQTASRLSKLLVYLFPFMAITFGLLPIESFFYAPGFANEKILFLGNAGYSFNLILLFYSIVALINLEATLRSSSGKDRWEIKYTVMGVGAIVAIHIFYYSHALLYRSINMYLLPVRTGIVLTAVLLIGFSMFRHKAMDTEFAVSRRIIYRSLSLIIVGIYLLGLGLMGEGMRYFGPNVGENIATFLGFIGALSLLMVIFSERFRRNAYVFINKNFFSHKYDYRVQWLNFTQRTSLKHSFDELLSSIAEGFRNTLGVKDAAIWLKEKSTGQYVCSKSLEHTVCKTKPDQGLIDYLKHKKWILNTKNYNCRDIVAQHEKFIRETEASLIIPLFRVDDLIGFIILKEALVDYEYNYEDYDLLKTLAKQTAVVISNAILSEELIEAKEMEAMGKLSSFILHDLKNATSMLSMIAQNAEDHIDNPEFQRDAIKAVSHTSEKMKSLIEKLKELPRKPVLDLEYSNLGDEAREAINHLRLNGDPVVTFSELAPVHTALDREEVAKVIINLVINAIDASDNHGPVNVKVGVENNSGYVQVSDKGCGMSEEFIEKKLFKPFQTTKQKGLGIGLYQCKTIAEAHGGKLKVNSSEGRGTDFTLYLPLTKD